MSSPRGLTRDQLLLHLSALKACVGTTDDSGDTFPITAADLKSLCSMARRVFLKEPALLELSGPITVVGDIHGQFMDLLHIFQRQGFPPHNRYLFLGDFIDRGEDGLEVMAMLMVCKLLYPAHIHLLRGNHEASLITVMYGFYAECLRKLGEDSWRDVCEVFDCLPVAATIGQRMLCVHGGISPQLRRLEDINAIQRPAPLDHEAGGLLTDLVWSDPSETISGWVKNRRGAGWMFGLQALMSFKRRHNLAMVIRAHETVCTGFATFGNNDLVTVFSAPNYCGYRNTGATMSVGADLTYTFELYMCPQDSTPETGVTEEAASICKRVAVKAATEPATPAFEGHEGVWSPFAAAQEQHDAPASPGSSAGVFAHEYAVPASPFASVSPPASAFAVQHRQQGSVEGMLSSLKPTQPSSPALCSDAGDAHAFCSQHSATLVSVSSC